ncbi:hypothetical protein LINPERHAP2_LOCUS965 [Linum perenne]
MSMFFSFLLQRPPFKFAIKHRRKLGMRNLSNGQLHVPNGAVFEVGLTRRKDRKFLWFKRRWMIFMEENSVKEDFLLTFEYVHHSRFNVRIFKKSATVLYLSLIFETEQEWTAVEKDLVEKEIPVVLKFHQRFCNMSTRSRIGLRRAINNKVVDSFTLQSFMW